MHLCGININLQRVLVQETHDLQAGNECQSLYSFLGANNGMKSICTGGIKGLVQNGKWSTTRWNGTFLHHVAAHFHFGQELDNKGKAQKAKGTFFWAVQKMSVCMGLRTKDLFFLLLALFCFFYCIFLSCDTMHRDTKAQKCFLRLHLDAFFSHRRANKAAYVTKPALWTA